jgi:hypothetical protein
VRATLERWTDQRREVELLRARGWYRDPPPIPPEEGEWGLPAARVEARTRIWAAQPYWLRWETSFKRDGVQGGESVGVREGERAAALGKRRSLTERNACDGHIRVDGSSDGCDRGSGFAR